MRINWVTKLIIYFVIITIGGPFFDNWTSVEKILFLSDSYVGKCPKSSVVGPATNTFRCEAQQFAVSGLLSYARMFEFISSVATGICVDRFGPRIVCVIGMTLCLLSWLFISLFSKSGTFLILSMIFIGISTNATLFPSLTIVRYTKKYKTQAMIFITLSSSFTCFLVKFIEMVINKTELSPSTVSICFILIFLSPCLLATIFVFPHNLRADVKAIGESFEEDQFSIDSVYFNELSRQSSIILKNFSLKYRKSPENVKKLYENISSRSSFVSDEILVKRHLDQNKSPQRDKNKYKENIILDLKIDVENLSEKNWTWKGFLDCLKVPEVIVSLFYYCLNVCSITFSQQSYTIIFSDNNFLLEFAEFILPFSFIPCLLFMVLTSFISSYVLFLTFGLIWSVLNICSVFTTNTAGILTSLLFTISYSMYNTHIYIYIERFTNKDYYSSVLGLINTAGGISMLTNLFLINPRTDHKTIVSIHFFLLGIRIAFLFIFTILWAIRYVKERKIEGKTSNQNDKLSNNGEKILG